ncbi:MAG: low-specificity L-threonine aldolase [Atribacterota bacterium]
MIKNLSSQNHWIDLRSDTVTHPTEEMLDAMRNAEVGDDVYGDDPTVNLLEKKAAEKVGKEASLFVPSGTFGNQLALLTHTQRGDEVIIPPTNHIVMHEVGASAVIAGVQLRFIHDDRGRVEISELCSLVRDSDIHHPRTGLICLENAHSSGTVIPLQDMKDVYTFARSVSIPVHLDGARIFNAAVSLGMEAGEIAQYCDSVMFCLSKGLCSPIGSLLAGTKPFIDRARKNRKLMGGGLRQVGYLAAPGLISLEKMTKRLGEDHENAHYLATKLQNIKGITVLKDRLDINMVFFQVHRIPFDADSFVQYLYDRGIKMNLPSEGEFRFVTHYWVQKRDIDSVMAVINTFFSHS